MMTNADKGKKQTFGTPTTKLDSKSEIAINEERVLEFWQQAKIFEKSVQKDAPKGDFVFYDGPPFITGLPHYATLLPSIAKDVVPRYWTMNGYSVKRVWGWDCHGLPAENKVEEQLGLKNKKDIENLGVGKFIDACQLYVKEGSEQWRWYIDRIGRWVDMDNAYKTMNPDYMESVLWGFKELYKKGYLYEGYRSSLHCPRCATPLSKFEITMDAGSYKDVTEKSVVVKFELLTEKNIFVLAWTTTPWTLPGNLALAVGKDIQYVKIKIANDNNFYILAKDKAQEILKDKEFKILDEFNGARLVGWDYKPIFDLGNVEIKQNSNVYKIYHSDHVNIEDGTGIVHIAPNFGEEDFEFGKNNNLPLLDLMDENGIFTALAGEWEGLYFKKANKKVLENENIFFAVFDFTHSYPFCYRCNTALIYKTQKAWYLNVEKIREKLLSSNQEINWVPEYFKEGRFKHNLETAPDWCVSRSRYWGTPLPVWKCEKCEKLKVIGSVEEIKQELKTTGSRNKYFSIRHGEADNNVLNICSKNKGDEHHLTEKGKAQITQSAQELKDNPNLKDGQGKIDLIITSPYIRTKESAEILAKELGVSEIIEDDRIAEMNNGEFGGKKVSEYREFFETPNDRFTKTPQGGENFNEIKKRTGEFLTDIDKKYSNKNILIVSHENIVWLLEASARGLTVQEALALKEEKGSPKNAEWREIDFTPLPHNQNYELDLHRPYIDEIKFGCECGGEMKRTPEVLDCWFESGSMPFAQFHYPFKKKDEIKDILPADFIIEYTGQLRGWFYYLHVLSNCLFDSVAFKNVIVTGVLAGTDGRKMSKSYGNYPDPKETLEKYGSDALRMYFMGSPIMLADDMSLSEIDVQNSLRKNILLLWNVSKFFEMFRGDLKFAEKRPLLENILDKWIILKLDLLIKDITEALNKYNLPLATRPITAFVEDLSTWYIRRSRERVKGENKTEALSVIQYVLLELSKTIAPLMPFLAEEIWQKVTGNNFADENRSVHLENWPIFGGKASKNEIILEEMAEVRKIVSLGLEARATAGIKVRQPLKELKVQSLKSKGKEDLLDLIKDELNVKEIAFDAKIENEVELDLEITADLKAEGDFRELARNIQKFRKEEKLTPSDSIILAVDTDELGENLINKFADELKQVAGIKKIDFVSAPAGAEIKINNLVFKIKIIK